MANPVTITRNENIAVVRIDNPPVNALSQAVRSGLDHAVATVANDDKIKAVVLICAGRTFIAGADIREFGQPLKPPSLPDVINRIEACPKAWVAAMHGTALGGGFEVALGCHYRVGTPGVRVGLPEVHLGLIPGAGGTVRLPRLIDVDAAIDMVTGGKPVNSDRAHELGIFDLLCESDTALEQAAIDFANEITDAAKPEALSLREPVSKVDDDFWATAEKAVAAKARGQLSPLEGFGSIRDGIGLPFAEALKGERERFAKLRDSDQSKAMRHVFFAERLTTKVPELDGVKPIALARTGVIGGGTMGAGIAASMLLAGLEVTMVERDDEAAANGAGRVQAILASCHKRGIIDGIALEEANRRFATACDYASLADADLVIEAVFEEMAVKRDVFAKLEAVCRNNAVLASNTSYMDVNEIAAATHSPERILGMHFFSPAHVMRLVEVIKTERAAPEIVATGFALAKRLGKVAVLSGVCEGFIGNRILSAYRAQCDYMLEDGAVPAEIDAAMRNFGLPMGIFEMQDMAGLDIGWARRKRLAATRDPNERYVTIADRLCELGRFGQKTGKGWYDYSAGGRKGVPDPIVEQIIVEEAAAKVIVRRAISEAEIIERITGAMIDEGRKILDQGIAIRASDIDIVMILGYGFPRWRGGPMFMAGITD